MDSCRRRLAEYRGKHKRSSFARYTEPMVKEKKLESELCPRCDRALPVGDALRGCAICRTLFCHYCAVVGFGREFCSDRCRDFFFHGDDDEEEEEEKES
ncbi:MAG: hypothetical protein GY906_21905 [bacterium]|nr:hypothetical protein [bacterium]